MHRMERKSGRKAPHEIRNGSREQQQQQNVREQAEHAKKKGNT